MDASPNQSPVTWINNFRQYLQEVRVEFDKISWPSQKEYVGGTVGVLIIVALMTVFLGILDWLLSIGFNWLIESLPRWLNG